MRRRERADQSRRSEICSSERGLILALSILLTAASSLAQTKPAQVERATDPTRSHSPRKIIVSIADRKLALMENDRLVKSYPVAVGTPGAPSPAGEFKIANRIVDPAWYAPGKVIAPGKDNPLGTRWIGLDKKGYGIHGTNQPRSVGHRASHGCIRMRKQDVEELFELVRPGDVVELRNERTAELAALFDEGRQPAAASEVKPAAAPAVVMVAAVTPNL